MSEGALIPSPGAGPARGAALRTFPAWVVGLAVVIPTFMEILDTTIANVALRYIAGGLSAPATDSEWVITSYLAANAIILPMSGWISTRLGRRNYFILSIAVFTIASALCGMATNLGALIAARVLQGLAGGGLQPCSQAILLDAFPIEKRGTAMTMFGMAALLGPVVGPSFGGYITDNFGWQWIFYVNVPVGIVAFFFCRAVVTDPAYLREQTASARRNPTPFDFTGLILLSFTMIAWEIGLSKGQEWDWFGDPFWRVQSLAVVFVTSLIALVWRELRTANPLVNFRALKDRNFRSCCIILACSYGVLYAGTTSLPAMLQTLYGYDATMSGLVLSPAGLFAIATMLVVGRLLTKGVDARLLMAAGVLLIAGGNYWMAIMNLSISPWQIVWPRVVIIVGLGLLFAPLNVAAFATMPIAIRGAAVGLLALLRNEGGSVGTSVAQTVLERREQFHTLRLNENMDQFNPAVTSILDLGQKLFMTTTGDPVAARMMAYQLMANMRDRQATALAYFDIFWVAAVLAISLLALIAMMKKVTVPKGTLVSAE
ncbi:MAG: DHA2 family efflux MFS transporter permease subunit [Phycisphaerales bacterium]|nr:DHA2 family efflux MFS transporter permease subunit [Phycisphaerales bacterium]